MRQFLFQTIIHLKFKKSFNFFLGPQSHPHLRREPSYLDLPNMQSILISNIKRCSIIKAVESKREAFAVRCSQAVGCSQASGQSEVSCTYQGLLFEHHGLWYYLNISVYNKRSHWCFKSLIYVLLNKSEQRPYVYYCKGFNVCVQALMI